MAKVMPRIALLTISTGTWSPMFSNLPGSILRRPTPQERKIAVAAEITWT